MISATGEGKNWTYGKYAIRQELWLYSNAGCRNHAASYGGKEGSKYFNLLFSPSLISSQCFQNPPRSLMVESLSNGPVMICYEVKGYPCLLLCIIRPLESICPESKDLHLV